MSVKWDLENLRFWQISNEIWRVIFSVLILKSIWHGNSSDFKSIKHVVDLFVNDSSTSLLYLLVNMLIYFWWLYASVLQSFRLFKSFPFLAIDLIVCIQNCQSVNNCPIEPRTCQSSISLWYKAQNWRYVTTSISLWKFPVKYFPVFAESAVILCILYNTLNIMHCVWSLWIYAYSNWPMILFSKGYYRVFGSGADSLTDWMHSRGEFNLPEIDSLCVCQCFPAVSYHFIVFSAFLQYLHYESVQARGSDLRERRRRKVEARRTSALMPLKRWHLKDGARTIIVQVRHVSSHKARNRQQLPVLRATKLKANMPKPPHRLVSEYFHCVHVEHMSINVVW